MLQRVEDVCVRAALSALGKVGSVAEGSEVQVEESSALLYPCHGARDLWYIYYIMTIALGLSSTVIEKKHLLYLIHRRVRWQ